MLSFIVALQMQQREDESKLTQYDWWSCKEKDINMYRERGGNRCAYFQTKRMSLWILQKHLQ